MGSSFGGYPGHACGRDSVANQKKEIFEFKVKRHQSINPLKMKKTKQELQKKLIENLKNQLYNKKVNRKEGVCLSIYAIGVIALAIVTFNYNLKFYGSNWLFYIFLFIGWLPIIYNIKFTVSDEEINKKLEDFLNDEYLDYLDGLDRSESRLAKLVIDIKQAETNMESIEGNNIWRDLKVSQIREQEFLEKMQWELSLLEEKINDLK